MTNILNTIVSYKREEVEKAKRAKPVIVLEAMDLFSRPTFSLSQFLKTAGNSGIIAEFKRRSPSRGLINDSAAVADTAAAYAKGGAAAISVLTDGPSFGGSLEDLVGARVAHVPLLRKEFIIDEYQIIEAKAHGADVILLIAAILTPAEVKLFAKVAHSIGLETILEVHDETELAHITPLLNVIGVNNRNLKTFSVDLALSHHLASLLPKNQLKISESGIHSTEDIAYLKRAGYNGFLIGENFMKQADPGEAFSRFVQEIKQAI